MKQRTFPKVITNKRGSYFNTDQVVCSGSHISGLNIFYCSSQGDVYNMSLDLTCDSSGKDCLPSAIADEYWIKASIIWLISLYREGGNNLSLSLSLQITGLREVLVDYMYYVSAIDAKGNVKKTDIYHVYVDSGNVKCT